MKEALTLASQQPCSFETIYLRATAAVLSGSPDLALTTIQDISDQVPRYLVNALCDPHFLPLQAELKKIPEKLHADTKSETFKIDMRLAELKDVQQRAVAITGLNESLYSGIDKVRRHIDAIDDQIQNVDFKRDHILQNIESQVHWIDGALDTARSETNDEIARLSREIDANPEKTEPAQLLEKELSPIDRPKLENNLYLGKFFKTALSTLASGLVLSVILGFPVGCVGHSLAAGFEPSHPLDPLKGVFTDGMYFCMVLTMIASLFAGFKVVGAEKKKETERNASILRNHQAMMQRRASDHSDQVLSDQGAYEERLSVYQSYVLLNQKRAWQRTILTEINSILLRTQKRIA
jgi:Mg2+ and Co2+ transporter CorA